ncbi:MAG: TrkA family potassium uptake protein [Leptospirales bacterium]|nr:TrkA family potassium uptake protein [Leptospirales bacterium]
MKKSALAVIGLGDFGMELVRRLHAEGHETIAVDVSMQQVEEVADHCSEAICLDATDERALRRLDFKAIDAVILAGSQSFENELIMIDNLRRLGARRIVARFKTPLQLRILKMLGLEDVFNPEMRAALNMAEGFRHGGLIHSVSVRDGFHMIESPLPAGLGGLRVIDLPLQGKTPIALLAIVRPRQSGEEFLFPSPEFVLELGDRIVLFGAEKELDRLLADHR